MGHLRSKADWAGLALLIGIVAAVSYIGGSLGAQSYVSVVTMLVDLILVVALYVFIGISGVFSFGHVGFMAVGAYVTAILTVPVSRKGVLFPSMPEFLITAHAGVVEGIVIGALSAGLAAAVVSIPLMRLPALAIALGTLVLLVVSNDVASNWNSVTQGTGGMSGMPTSTTLNVALIWAAIAIAIAWIYKGSRSGLQLAASREDEISAEAVGVNVALHRRIAFTISASVAGLAGALFALQLGTLAPTSFFLDLTFISIAMLVVGGQRSLTGAVIGTLVVSIVQELLNSIENGQINLGFLSGRAGTPELGVAILLLMILIFRPSGLVGDREIEIPARWLRRAGHAPSAGSSGPAAEESKPSIDVATDQMTELPHAKTPDC